MISNVKIRPQTSIEEKPGCIQSALCILGDKWTPLLLSELVQRDLTFSDLEKSLEGISPRTLSNRLDKLLHEEIIQKILYCEKPKRYRYSLTKKGNELQTVLRKMAEWGEKYHK